MKFLVFFSIMKVSAAIKSFRALELWSFKASNLLRLLGFWDSWAPWAPWGLSLMGLMGWQADGLMGLLGFNSYVFASVKIPQVVSSFFCQAWIPFQAIAVSKPPNTYYYCHWRSIFFFLRDPTLHPILGLGNFRLAGNQKKCKNFPYVYLKVSTKLKRSLNEV